MGFGWLMVGYFFVSTVALYSPLAMIMLIGYPMMIIGLRLLAPYHKYLKIAFFSSFFSLPFAVYFGLDAFGKVGLMPAFLPAQMFATMEWLYFVFYFLFTALILFAITSLCGELSLSKWQETALRNLLVLGFTFALDLLIRLPIGFVAQISGYVGLLVLILRLATVFLNLYLIFGCYRFICPEGTEEEGMYDLDDLMPKEKKR